ncbi:hypothetical protein FJY63_10590 [Candidatus Sumerlaeota bacterium]|nr:hypothetical protein [Candidatus Sumerlaeota bacterium]
MRASMALREERRNWKEAAISAGNLSEMKLALGDLAGAVQCAAQAVAYTDYGDDSFQRLGMRTRLADALHQGGQRDEARNRFREAEGMQARDQPDFPVLYSFQGFWYCDFLLSGAERAAWEQTLSPESKTRNPELKHGCHLIEQRATRTLGWVLASTSAAFLDIALERLTLGRAALYGAILAQLGLLRSPESEIEEAVEGLRAAGRMDHLPRGLLSRAWLRFCQGHTQGARADLDEAWQIAERGSMRLHMADVLLYRARLFRAIKPYPWGCPHDDLAAARKLIEECGYWRRKEELEDAEAALGATPWWLQR